ncbi:MAG: methylmalonyl-CoA mutase [Deltaproteobacteria bacterium]|nr:methylmalonyl-CoA mutase [Deltaproteobacteria bacterium]
MPLFDPDALARIASAEDRWRRRVYDPDKERLERFETISGLPVEPLYTPADVAEMDYERDLGLPGEEPFVRGVYPGMYRARTWTSRQLAGFGPAEETNKRLKFLLKAGAEGVNCVFDYPTLRGYGSDDPLAYADVGLGGVAIDSLEDVAALFEGIPIDKISTSLVTCQPISNISVQSMFFAHARAKGLDLNQLAGTSQNDFLMETAITTAPGILPPHASFKLSCDAIEFCAKFAQRWNPISFAGYNYREAGCTAIQEIALVMANALACSQELLDRGLAIDDFAPRLSFFLSGHSDFFEEIAKYRAARRLWARIVKERFGTKNPRSLCLRFHVQTAGAALTAQQPLNNIARAAYHALSAVLGGAQSVHVDGFDEALCTPTELSSLTALRTQQILQLETRVTHTIDPLAGSYFVESLTNQLEKKIEAVIEDIEAQGGIVKAVESGWVQRAISEAAYAFQQDVETGRAPIVGVNCFQMDEESYPCQIFEVPETRLVQKEKLERLRAGRDPRAVDKALEDIRRCLDSGGNLMEVIVESVRAKITEGEISGLLKEKWGTWDQPLFF